MWLLYLALGIALFYAGLVSLATLFQTKLLFPVQMAAANRPILPRSAERLALTTPEGDQLIGVRLGSLSDPKPLLLGFGGNAWNADAMALYLHGLFPDHEVIAFHYRGYPPSSGEPSTKALFADSLTIFDHVQKKRAQGHCHRLQYRQRRGRLCSTPPPCDWLDPDHALRLLAGSGAGALSMGAHGIAPAPSYADCRARAGPADTYRLDCGRPRHDRAGTAE